MNYKKTSILSLLLVFCTTLFAQDTLTIFFENNIFELSEQNKNKLNMIVAKIKNKEIEKPISIIGSADFVGKTQSNQILSEKRAKSVEEYFLEMGLKPLEIKSAIGLGSSECKHNPMPKKGCPEHRRVDIIYVKALPVVKIQKADTTVQPKQKEIAIVESITETIMNTEVGKTLLLDHINFIGGSDVWLAESVPSIEKLLEVLTENPTIKIEIQGHICCVNTDENNLSTKRAFAIYNYLITNGIDKKRLSYKGFGRTRPLRNNPDETKNRRVEILILEK